MNAKNILTIGNITTIINTIALIVSGYIIGFLVSLGFNVPFDQLQLTSIISSIIFLIFGYINAKYHNTFWDNETDSIQIPANLNQSQITAIENYIKHQTGEVCNIIPKDEEYIEDLDIAGEYEQ